LALFTIVLSLSKVNKRKKEPEREAITYFSVEPLIEEEDNEDEFNYAEIIAD